MNFKGLEKKVACYWMIARIILFVVLFVPYLLGAIFIPKDFLTFYMVPTTIIIVITALYAFLFPVLEQRVYKFLIDEDKVIIIRGVLFKRRIVIPDVQIQDIGTIEGPIQMAFKICTINISTAGSTNFISCVNKEEGYKIVDTLRERVTDRLKQKEEENA